MDIKMIKEICAIPSTCGLIEAMYKTAGLEDDPFAEKVYTFHLNDILDLQFAITKSTSTPAFPVYLPLDVCTDVKKLIFDLINSKSDIIDFGQQMIAFGTARKSFSEAVKEYGYFGDDPVFYEGLTVHKKIVIRPQSNYFEISDEMVNSIELVNTKQEETTNDEK